MAYEIKRLHWVTNGPTEDGYQRWSAYTICGDYTIERKASREITWSFDDGYRTPLSNIAKSLAAAKREVFADWVERLRCALVEVRA